jgi:protein-tyrosine phosphatase
MRNRVAEADLDGQVHVESAGTGDWHVGESPDARSRAEAKRRGYRLDGQARQFQPSDFAKFDHVLAMDRSNLDALKRMAPDAASRAKVQLFREFDPQAPAAADVPDPYYEGGFDEVLDICERTCDALLTHLRKTHDL